MKYKRNIGKLEPGYALNLKYNEMVKCTNNFSKENIIGTFQFGKIYRGKYEWERNHYVNAMVKVWEVSETCKDNKAANLVRAMNEVILHQHEKMIEHPGMIEFIACCLDGEHISVLYNINPIDSVHNLVPKDTFTWLQRIKVALGIARLLKFFHGGTSKFIVRNIAATHILIDRAYYPKLCDFGMSVGGIFPNETMYKYKGSYGYVDPNIGCSGEWSEKTDVFAFGVLLLNLITKRVDIEEDKQSNAPLLYVWAWDQFESFECESGSRKSLVDKSLTKGAEFGTFSHDDGCEITNGTFSHDDGCEITNLAMKCVNKDAKERPTMKQVVKSLLKLESFKKKLKFLDVHQQI